MQIIEYYLYTYNNKYSNKLNVTPDLRFEADHKKLYNLYLGQKSH